MQSRGPSVYAFEGISHGSQRASYDLVCVLFHYVCAPCACNEHPLRSEEGIHHIWLEVVDGFTLWVLETKPRSFGREDNALSR